MNNKLNSMLEEFFEKNNPKNEEEANKLLQEFIIKYNNNEIEYKNTPLDDAYEILEKAKKEEDEKKATKLAKKAYEVSNKECLDAMIFLSDMEDNLLESDKILNDALAYEKERLTKEKYFDKENIGHFYGIFETRPYMRGLYRKAHNLIYSGKLTQAKEICLESLRLSENDNTGIRYLLFAIYALLEDEKGITKLYKKYTENNLEVLFPMFSLYYKLGKEEVAIKYLKMIDKANPNFIKYFKGTMKKDSKTPQGYFSIGDSSEIEMYFSNYDFLIDTMLELEEFVLKNLK